MVGSTMGYFNQPGQLGPQVYERTQEQINQGLLGSLYGIQGGMTGVGVDPGSPMGMALAQSATLGAGKQRAEAARDYGIAQEGLARQDIAAATQNYLNMLSSTFGLAQQQAAAAGGQAFPQVQPVNTMQPYADWLGMMSYGQSLPPENTQG
jgi:hypothetical protein